MITQLDAQQRDLVVRIANGQSYKTIGRAYHVGERAAQRHVRRLCDQVGARDRAHLVGLAFAARIITEADVEQPTAAAA